MKAIFLFPFIFFLLVMNLQAQEKKPVEDTLVIFKYPNGSISSKGKMLGNKPFGIWENFYENGNIKSVGEILNNKANGKWIFYNTDGQIDKEISYSSGVKNGEEKLYKNGKIIQTANYFLGAKNDTTKTFYDNGNIKSIVIYKNNLPEDKAYEFSEKGELVSIINYKKGSQISKQEINRYDSENLKTGIWIIFYDDNFSDIKEQISYSKGKKNGWTKYFDDKQNLIKSEFFINDSLKTADSKAIEVEIKREYFPNKKIKLYSTLKNGIKDGLEKTYDEKGKVISTQIYFQDKLIEQGDSISKFGKKQGIWKTFYITGELKSEGLYKDGKKQGQWKYYFLNGKIEQQGLFENDLEEEKWLWFYPEGILRKEEYYSEGKKHGISKEFDENSNIISEGQYNDGLKEGKWKSFFTDTEYSGEFYADNKNGQWIVKDLKNDEIITKFNYKNDLLDGESIYYYSKNKISSVQNFRLGEPHGQWIFYDDKGFVTLSIDYFNGEQVSYNNVKVATNSNIKK